MARRRLQPNDAGNVGVGTDSPAVLLHVAGQQLVVADSSGNAFEVRQVGTGNALVVEDSANPDSSPFVIDASGNVGIGKASPSGKLDVDGTVLATGLGGGLLASGNPAMDGVASAGTSAVPARSDHVHPTDTTRAPLASPAFTGVPTAPTAAAGTKTTQVATTAFVDTAVWRQIDAGTPASLYGGTTAIDLGGVT